MSDEPIGGDTESRIDGRKKRLLNLRPPWPKGTSGNPAGGSKKRLLDKVLEELLEAEDSGEAVKIAKALIAKARRGDTRASQLVAERTEGKPNQKVEVTGGNGEPLSIAVRFVHGD